MSDLKLSEFLAEHRASEFGLAPVSRATAIQMAIAIEADADALLAVTNMTQAYVNKQRPTEDDYIELVDALAALPEHLRTAPDQEGGKDEREDFSLPSGLLGGL